jgi:sulfur carrier protein ThiS
LFGGLLANLSRFIYNAFMQITFRDKKYELKGNIAARDAIKKIGLDPEAVLVVVNSKLVTDDVILKENDEVKLVAVVSGGAGEQGRRGARGDPERSRRISPAPLLPCIGLKENAL